MSAKICSQLHIQPHDTNRRMKMADGTEAMVLGDVGEVPFTVGRITYNLTFLVVKGVPFDLIFGRPPRDTIRAAHSFDKERATFRSGTKEVTVPLCADKENMS